MAIRIAPVLESACSMMMAKLRYNSQSSNDTTCEARPVGRIIAFVELDQNVAYIVAAADCRARAKHQKAGSKATVTGVTWLGCRVLVLAILRSCKYLARM